MAILYWALSNIEQEQIEGGFKITTTSDVPCHQWLRYTWIAPKKHLSVIERRGLLTWYNARFCFVAYHDIEQEEAGDTYEHTFIWTNWISCQTKWFYFWATLMGIKCFSTSCIFSKHYYAPTIFTAPATLSDGYAYSGWHTGYGVAHDAPGAGARTGLINVSCTQQRGTGDKWYITRGVLTFNTIALDPAWTLKKATLHFYLQHNYDPGGGPLFFINSEDIHLPLYAGSYAELKLRLEVLGNMDRDELPTPQWYQKELDPTKLYFLRPGGLTRLVIREFHEWFATPAGQGSGVVWGFGIFAFEETGKQPYLEIEYE